MSKFYKVFLITQVLFFNLNIICAQEVIISEPAEWIKKIEYPLTTEVSKYDISSGVYYKLIDYQSNFEKESSYYHFVQNILTSGGVTNASQLQVGYDTSYQKLNFHQLTIWRNGKPLDKTNEISFEYVKNEQSLESNIYSGIVTALVVIEDLRKNDLLEISYTLTGNNPVFEGAQYQLIPVEDVNPVDKIYARILYPNDANYTYQCVGCKDEISVKKNGGITELELERTNLEALELEDSMTPWMVPYGFLEISSTNSWQLVNTWALNIFQQNEDQKIDDVFKEIFYPEYTIDQKIDAIINFVQDEIRYMGIESGIGNIKPFSPNQTISQRFGDCKDKSLLMVSMLRKIGLDQSYPALVNANMLGNVSQFLTSGHVFNHCIVYFEHEGRSYWLDPTYSYQGGTYKNLVTFDYEKALIVKHKTKSLTEMKVKDELSGSVVTEILDISSFDQPAELNVTSTMKGDRADNTRQFLEYYSRKELSESYGYYYGIVYPTLQEKQELSIKDNELENTINTEESYTIKNIWKDDMEGYEQNLTAIYEPANLYGYLSISNCKSKKYPVYFRHPVKYEQKTIIKLPETLAIEIADRFYDNVAFSYSQKFSMLDAKTIEIHFDFNSKIKEILPEDFSEVCSDINEILNNMSLFVSYPKPGTSALNFSSNSNFHFQKEQENFNSYKSWKYNISNSSNSKDSSYIINDIASIYSDSTKNNILESDILFDIVDEQPSYPKGTAAFYKYIGKNMEYPKEARKLGIEGKVFVSFVVLENGELGLVEVIQGIGGGCDEEAMKAIKSAGSWNPGIKDDKAVKVRMILPITFKL